MLLYEFNKPKELHLKLVLEGMFDRFNSNFVSGKKVSDLLYNNTYHAKHIIDELTNGINYIKRQISQGEAKQILKVTRNESAWTDYWETEKEQHIKSQIKDGTFDYKKHPSIVHTQFIWDGRHRMKMAVKAGIPVWILEPA